MSSHLTPHSLYLPAQPMNIDTLTATKPEPLRAATGLPTPSSLPRHQGPLFGRREEGTSAKGREGSPSDELEEETFAMEVEGDQNGETETGMADGAAVVRTDERTPFASNVAIRRPYRARYSHVEETPSIIEPTQDPDDSVSPALSFKRTFEEVSSSTGTTSPPDSIFASTATSFSPFTSATPTSPRPPASYRHSFDSQRATATSVLRSRFLQEPAGHATLRRRSPGTSRASSRDRRSEETPDPSGSYHLGEPLDRSKRRRSSVAPEEEPFDEWATQTLSSAFAPASGQPFPVDPTLSDGAATGSPSDDLPPIRRSRLSLPSLSLATARSHPSPPLAERESSLCSLRTTQPQSPTSDTRRRAPSFLTFRRPCSSSQLAPPVTTTSSASSTAIAPPPAPLQPRSARSRPDPMREREFDPLVAFWREEREHERASGSLEQRGRSVLGEVEEGLTRVLERADEDIAWSESMIARADEGIVATERLLGSRALVESPDDLPSFESLAPADVSSRRPLLGLSIESSRHTASEPVSRLSSPSSLPTSPRSSDDNVPLGTSASRALHFLSNLRSRRRIPRTNSGGPAIEDPRREDWDDTRESTSEQPRLWGQVTGAPPSSSFRARGRGPTARANEFWREGSGPGAPEHTRREEPSWRSRVFATPASPGIEWGGPAMRESGSGEARPWEREESPSAGRGAEEFERGFEDWLSEGRGRARGARELRERQRASFSSRRNPTSLFSPLPAAVDAPSTSTTGTGRPAIRIPRPTFPSARYAERRAERAASLFAEEEEEGEAPAEREWRPPALPLMLPSGSSGRRFVFPHPAHAAGPSLSRAEVEEDRSVAARFGTDEHERDATRSRYHPAFGFEATRYTLSTTHLQSDEPSLRPFGANPPASDTAPERPPLPRLPVRGASLADALARFGSRSEATDTTLRRRHLPGEARSELDDTDSTDRLLQRQVRSERLASLRRERAAMRSLLGGMAGGAEPLEEAREASPPSSPGARRRGLADFLRGIGGGRARIGAMFFDDEFPHFFGRDSAALDPRNYLDDDDFDTSYESLLRLSERLGDVKPKGAAQAKISELQKFLYKDWPFPPPKEATATGVATTSAVRMEEELPTLARRGMEKEERCAVCLMDYEEDDAVLLGTCLHGFHEECLSSWLKTNGSCPVCRRDHA